MSEKFKGIKLIWLFIFVIIAFLTIINSGSFDTATIGTIAIFLHIIISIIILGSLPSKIATLLTWAFVVRVLFMFWDLYAKHIFTFPNSGGDSEVFYYLATLISGDLSYLSETITGGLYTKLLGLLFYLTGPLRILGHYINVLIGTSIIVIIYKILLLLRINSSTGGVILLLTAFFPNSLVMSAILLREIIPTFFVALSLLWFIKWFQKQSMTHFIYCLLMLGIASMFHSGVIGIAIGYLFAYLFYSQESKKFTFSFRNIVAFIPIFLFLFLFITQFGDTMFFKFSSLGKSDNVYDSVMSARGQSAYLEELTINSPSQLLIYGPIREFYFLFSPIPIDWRGIQDIVTFLFDSIFYFYVFYFFIKNRKQFLSNKSLIYILLFSILVVSFVYGIGVSNAGTALRHRQKILPLFLILLAIMMDERKRLQIHLKMLKNRSNEVL